jgi:iron complex transport system ATP-binding protein
LLDLSGIVVRRGDFSLCINSLRINRREMIAIVGNNGSGKSTFLSVLGGLLPYEGSYMINDREFGEIDKKDRHRLISLLPQEGSLSMPFDVFYVVLSGRFPLTNGRHYGEEDYFFTERIMKWLDVWHLKDREFVTLSGGEKQRVLLARALNRDASVLLLDEPLSGIDLRHQYETVEILKKLQKDRIILVVIHDISLALREFDRFLCFKEGRLLYDLSRDEIEAEQIGTVFDIKVNFLRHENGVFIYREE